MYVLKLLTRVRPFNNLHFCSIALQAGYWFCIVSLQVLFYTGNFNNRILKDSS